MTDAHTTEEKWGIANKLIALQQAGVPIQELGRQARMAESYKAQLEIAQSRLAEKDRQLDWALARIAELEAKLQVRNSEIAELGTPWVFKE